MLGKKILNNVYWHSSLTPAQADDVQQHIAEAEALANVQAGTDYNIVKYDSKSQSLSLLWYPGFFDEAFPALAKSYRINLDTRRVEKRSYQASLNPPILHRKELFISPNDPHNAQFKELTTTAEQLGLFANTLRIGFKQAWENLIAEKGFQLVDHQFVPLGNVEDQDDPTVETSASAAIARHLTALSRSKVTRNK